MKIVVDIGEYEYARIKEYFDALPEGSVVDADKYRIANGTPLPKGHGRLIDADKLKSMYSINQGNFNTVVGIQKWIDHTETIIEADKEQE